MYDLTDNFSYLYYIAERAIPAAGCAYAPLSSAKILVRSLVFF